MMEGETMSLVVNHNLMAANVANTLNSHYGRLSTSTQRLSSGMRINSAADDAAGLAIRELMRADIASFQQGARNANDAISLIQTADGALSVIDEKLIRMKELAEQAATGTYDSTQRLMIESEYQQMASEITRIANATDFNGIHLLDGNLEAEEHDGSGMTATGKLKVHFGTGNDSAEDYYYIQIAESTAQAFGVGNAATWEDASKRIVNAFSQNISSSLKTLANSGIDATILSAVETSSADWVTQFSTGLNTITNISDSNQEELYNAFKSNSEVSSLSDLFDKKYSSLTEREQQKVKYALGRAAMQTVAQSSSVMTGFGDGAEHPVTYNVTGLLDDGSNVTSAFSGDPNVYDGTSGGLLYYLPPTNYDATQYVSTTGANAPTEYPFAFTAPAVGSYTDGTDDEYGVVLNAINSTLSSAMAAAAQKADEYDYAGYSIATQEDAQKALVAINNAIVAKDKIRADLGATQNRLENTITNLNTMAENLQAAESRISDVDVSTEMTNFVRNQILTQSAVAMLAQANSLPQMAMQLIGG